MFSPPTSALTTTPSRPATAATIRPQRTPSTHRCTPAWVVGQCESLRSVGMFHVLPSPTLPHVVQT